MTATRRLAAILAADVAGYSRLMGADEEGTHERLKAHRRELVDPKISEHDGYRDDNQPPAPKYLNDGDNYPIVPIDDRDHDPGHDHDNR